MQANRRESGEFGIIDENKEFAMFGAIWLLSVPFVGMFAFWVARTSKEGANRLMIDLVFALFIVLGWLHIGGDILKSM